MQGEGVSNASKRVWQVGGVTTIMMDRNTEGYQNLRKLAEEKALLDEETSLKTLSLDDARLLFHELRVHQIELEMQNEELRRTQHELAASRARYFALYDLAPVGYLTLNDKGLIHKVNLAAATMLGVVRSDLLGKPISAFIFREDQDLYYLHREKVFEANQVQVWEMRMVRSDGSLFWAHLRSTPAHNGEYWVTLIDINERKQAENELNLFLDLVPDMVCIASTDSQFKRINRAFTKKLGFSEQELLATSFLELVHPDDKDTTMSVVATQCTGSECTINYTNRYRCKDGSYRWLEWLSEPLFGTTLLYAAARDITERKQSEMVLHSRLIISDYAYKHSLDELLTKVLDEAEILTESRIGFFHFVETDQVTLSLQAWSSNTTSSFCTAEGKGEHYPLDRAGVWADCIRDKKALIHNSYESLSNRRGLPPGHAALQRELVVPIVRNDLIVAVLGVGNKTTDYTEQEMTTLENLANLAWDIVKRKRAEDALRQAKDAAEAANIAKCDFLATMSHEIRTPLGAMLGNVELLEGSTLTPQQQEYLKDCKSASQMLLQVINDVLDFSKIEAGKLELASEAYSFSSMGRQLVRMFSASARQKGLDLSVSLADDLPEFIRGDQQRLRQIISNLLGNAIKFTRHGTVTLEIGCEEAPSAVSPDKAVLRIVISDTGIGIPRDKLDHIFESFTQVESFGTRSASGTGLGLPICRRLLALMGGSITVSSVPGEGSVFTVLLPVAIAESREQVPDRTQAHIGGQILPLKILLADDEQAGRTVAQKLLQRRGYKVTAVENGAELLDALQKDEFDIVLTDISMPDMEGTQVARIIRSGERPGINPRIPIIAMTAHAFSEDRERFLAAGINGYVAKPVNLEELFKQIEELCSSLGECGYVICT